MKIAGWEINRTRGAARALRASGARGQRAHEEGNGTSWLQNLVEIFAGPRSAAGVRVNPHNALTISAVYTAVRIIAGTIASLPLHVYRRDQDGRSTLALRHWAYPLLHDSPNEYHSSFVWRELMVAHAMLWGNAYARIEWMGNGSAAALYPLMPWLVTPYLAADGEKRYEVRLARGGVEDLESDEVLHVPGLGCDGLRGQSVIAAQRDALGLSKAMEIFSSAFFRNGAKPGAVLEVPQRMNEVAQAKLSDSIMERFGHVEDAFKIVVLEEGAKLHTYTMPLEDAQLLESRKFSRAEIFGWYGVPPHLAGDTERQTSWGTGIEQMDIGYAKHTITPWLVRIEQECARKLFGRGSGLYARFSLDGLLRGDFASRMEGFAKATGGPFLSRNEVRELEDWPAIAGGEFDRPLRPLNMSALEEAAGGEGADSGAASDATAPADDASASAARADAARAVEIHVAAPAVNVAPPAVTVFSGSAVDHELQQRGEARDRAFAELAIRVDENEARAEARVRAAAEQAVHANEELRERLCELQSEAGALAAAVERLGRARFRKLICDAEGNPIGVQDVESLEEITR